MRPAFRRILRLPLSPASQAARDVEDELALHIELRTEELMREGMTPDDARREALRAFGDPERARRELLAPERRRVRRARLGEWIGDLARDVRYAARGLGRNPAFTAVAVVTLALGIGANTALYSVIDAVLLEPLPVRDPERLAMIWEANADRGRDDRNVVNPGNFMDWRQRSRTFASMAGFWDTPGTVIGADGPREIAMRATHPDLFHVLGVPPLLGRPFTAADGAAPAGQIVVPTVVIISHDFWRDHFAGDSQVVGRRLDLAGRTVEVIGVMGPQVDFLSPEVALWVPTDFAWANRTDMGRFIRVVGRLAPGATLTAAAEEMEAIAAELRRADPDFNLGWHSNVVPLDEQVKGDVRPALLVLLGAVGVLLLVACVNVANLLMVRAASRRTEIAVRASLGAGRARIVRGLLIESLLLSVIGGALGAALAYLATRALATSVPDALRVPRLEQATVDIGVLAVAAVAAVITGVLFGLAPVLEAFRSDLVSSLREGGRGTSAGRPARRLRSAMVVGEIALSLVLLTAAGLLLRSFIELQRTDLGIRPEHVLTGRITLRGGRYPGPEARVAFFDRAIESIAALPAVEAVGAVTWLPLGGSLSATSYYPADRPRPEPDQMPGTQVQAVQGDFFGAMGIPVVRGRTLDRRDAAGAPEVAVVNRAFAERTWPGQDPLGKRFILPWGHDRNLEVVGVVGDIRHKGVETAPEPGVFLPHAQFSSFATASIVVRSVEENPALGRQITDRIREIDPNVAVADVEPMSDVVRDAIARPRLTSVLVAGFAGLALLLAAVGIYGVVSYTVSLRAREMGVRRALGAQVGDVARLVLGDALRLGAIGVAIGLGAAVFATSVLERLLYGVRPTDPLTFAGTAALLLVVTAIAALAPAVRAARVSPTEAIRAE